MIEGEINPFDEAVIPIRVRASDGRTFEVEATIDTGFTGFLTLPTEDIQELRLVFEQEEQFTVGRGVSESFAIFRATIIWDGTERSVPVLATETGTMIGMKMLKGSRLSMVVIDGGKVEIETVG